AEEAFAVLREVMPAIVKARRAEAERAPEFFSDRIHRAAQAVLDLLNSDVPARALHPETLPDHVSGWQWSALALREDVEAMLGGSPTAVARFIAAAAEK